MAELLLAPAARPTGTYRIQLHADFGFADARELVPYLDDLGVSTLYLSPVLQAAAGSQHGYDVVDHTRVSTDLGGAAALERLAATAHEAGMSVLVDVVPNHMAFPAEVWRNAPLADLLRHGAESAYASWFDIDWAAGDGRIGLPVLGEPLEQVLAAKELSIDEHDGQPVVRYGDRVLPVAPGTEGDDIGEVLDRQHWRLASWRDKASALTYRRFFDVDELIAVRVELDEVFDATSAVLVDLYARGVVDGFRIDHPDGLADPEGYLERLAAAAPGAWLLVEKILAPDEALPTTWPAHGTTGYDFIRALQTALVPPVGEHLDQLWTDLGGAGAAETEAQAMRDAVGMLLEPEVARLTRAAVRAAVEADQQAEVQLEPDRCRAALVELLVAARVYRAYLRPGRPAPAASLAELEQTVARARTARPDLADELTVLHALLSDTSAAADPDRPATCDLLVRFQQTCGPALAKGVEDTAFYRMHRLVALAEVGGDLDAFDRGGPAALHRWAQAQADMWPYGLTALTTHDTKRSEDVRARLLALAEDTSGWDATWALLRAQAAEAGVDARDAYLLLQTVLGAWPLSEDRLAGYLQKALREGKTRTTWTEPDETYEGKVLQLARLVLSPGSVRTAVTDLVRAGAHATRVTTLAAKLVQLTAPGVPDVYQGTELVALSLVDPDNRRPVDYDARRARLHRLRSGEAPADLDDEKLLVTMSALRRRKDRPHSFAGSHQAFESEHDCLLGFVRGGDHLTLVTRWPTTLAARGGWGDSTLQLPDGVWTDALTGRRIGSGRQRVSDVLEQLPVALLVR
jgi:(1->4)-alpha-D-glucan 1-alpha-D-glucosylmutase